MRKFSKLLAVMLTLCLLFGAITAIFASASEENRAVELDITKDTANKNDPTGASSTFASENTERSKGVTSTNISEFGYTRIHKDAKAKTNSKQKLGSWSFKVKGMEAELHDYEYLTFDFDIAFDQYVYTWGDQTVGECFTAENDEAAKTQLAALSTPITDETKVAEILAAKKVAIPDDINFYPYIQISKDNTWDTATTTLTATNESTLNSWKYEWTTAGVYLIKDDNGDVYATFATSLTNAKAATTKVPVNSDVDVFNHVTYVISVDTDASDNLLLTPHAYINGEYVGSGAQISKPVRSKAMKYARLYRMNTYLYQGETDAAADAAADNYKKIEKYKDQYSIAIDNLAVNYYKTGALDYSTPLYQLENVVYNANYVTPNTNTYATIGDNPYRYYVIDGAFYKLQENQTIHVYNVGKDYKLPKRLSSFTVKVEAGEFSLSAEDQAIYSYDATTGKYSPKLFAEVDGTPYADIDQAFMALKEGGTITITGTDSEAYTLPEAFNLKSFKIAYADTTSSFNFADEKYDLNEVSGMYEFNKYITVNGNKYYTVEELSNNFSEGCNIVVSNMAVTDFMPVVGNNLVSSFNVDLKKGASLTLDTGCGWRYIKDSNGTYTQVFSGDVQASVKLINFTKMEFHIYIPVIASANGTFSVAQVTDGTSIKDGLYTTATGNTFEASAKVTNTTIDNKEYIDIYWGSTRVDYITNDTKKAYVDMQYTTDGQTCSTATRFEAVFSYMKYVMGVVDRFGVNSPEGQLAVAMTDYKVALNLVLKSESETGIDTISDSYLKTFYEKCGCTCFEKVATYKYDECKCINRNYTAESNNTYIKVGETHDNTYEIDENTNGNRNTDVFFGVTERYIYMYVKATAGQKVVVTYTGIKGNKYGDYTIEKIADSANQIDLGSINVTDVDNNFHIAVYNPVAAAEGEETETSYELAYEFDYSIYDFSASANHVELVKALRRFAIVAENYKVDLAN